MADPENLEFRPLYWWVNHKQTFAQEIKGNYLWSPVTQKRGVKSEFYNNMTRIRPGDVVFSYADTKIRAVGVCVAPASLMPKPSEFGTAGEAWVNEGWRVPVRFSKLDEPLHPKVHMNALAQTLPDKYSPIRPSGDGNEGAYFAAVPQEMAEKLIGLIGLQWQKIDLTLPITASESVAEEYEQDVVKAIQNRTDIGVTEKLRLTKARRGQGIYRSNVENFESSCRVTGMGELRHLRASHIKPWRLSSDFEKLDGNNGLLMSPHVDHLFDQGYISFNNSGELIISPVVSANTLMLWQVQSGKKCGAFRTEQLPYIAFHREFILKKAR